MNHITREQALALSEKTASIEPDNWAVECQDLCNAAIEWHISQAAPDPLVSDDLVICPECCSQFRAIPVNVQKLMLDAGFEPPFTQAAPKVQVPLTEVQRIDIITNWFVDEADITRALQMLTDFEQTSGIGETK